MKWYAWFVVVLLAFGIFVVGVVSVIGLGSLNRRVEVLEARR